MVVWIGPERIIAIGHREYDVTINRVKIITTVTWNSIAAAEWIRDAYNYHADRVSRSNLLRRYARILRPGLDNGDLIVGFDAKLHRPYGIIQLFVGRRCLIYQISVVGRHAISVALLNFFRNRRNHFASVDVERKMSRLRRDYGIGRAARNWNLGAQAADILVQPDLVNAGLRQLARVVLETYEFEIRWLWLSGRWNSLWLRPRQVLYATFHAYLSYEIAWNLYRRHIREYFEYWND